MQFYESQIFHIFNQGNNRDAIFFNNENYAYFIQKIRRYILPYGKILAYCLMPNHFHILFYVERLTIPVENNKNRSLNDSIGIMLMSYTSAINKQENRSGSLFRSRTKIMDEWVDKFLVVGTKNETKMFLSNNDYARVCFNYIHNNPIKAGLTQNPEDWVYSSAKDYKGLRQGTLCDQDFTRKIIGG